ncbi:MAG TPA: WXG100 family type VII secretion target [Pseudonocardiaceae bacterium]|nr:WXG100 family type VII secretion target [Pseudonocardiaceae bacterium]
MATLVVDFAALDRLHTAISSSIEDASQHLQTLAEQVRRLSTEWSGAASDGFQSMVSDWLAAATDLQEQLAFLRTVVETAHENHASAVATNINMWQV